MKVVSYREEDEEDLERRRRVAGRGDRDRERRRRGGERRRTGGLRRRYLQPTYFIVTQHITLLFRRCALPSFNLTTLRFEKNISRIERLFGLSNIYLYLVLVLTDRYF